MIYRDVFKQGWFVKKQAKETYSFMRILEKEIVAVLKVKVYHLSANSTYRLYNVSMSCLNVKITFTQGVLYINHLLLCRGYLMYADVISSNNKVRKLNDICTIWFYK